MPQVGISLVQSSYFSILKGLASHHSIAGSISIIIMAVILWASSVVSIPRIFDTSVGIASSF